MSTQLTTLVATAVGERTEVIVRPPVEWRTHPGHFTQRRVYAAAHVIPRVGAQNVPGAPADIDWDSTLAFRRHLFEYGFGVAEAMDTAQRNMGLDWPATKELITRSTKEAHAVGAHIISGVNTDHRTGPLTVGGITDAYLEQLAVVESSGSDAILMPSRHLTAVGASADEYKAVYAEVISQATNPVTLHWLGEAFDPHLRGYWGTTEYADASETLLQIISGNPGKVVGVKVSLLSEELEIDLRSRLPRGSSLFTGDDFNYPTLIRGDGRRYSDALLGAFAAVAPAASSALRALDDGDLATYDAVMESTVALSRKIFEPPTFNYKTGIAFLSWLCGHQPAFEMVAGLHANRSAVHLSSVFTLANTAGLLGDPELATHRFNAWASTVGIR
ncbi:DUF993 family protein [Rhodococcus sp. IEGM 1381]|nr:DUF993 family protein [Rhodococcus sp. IEGM 1381]MDI9897458.1 DUF993 family protein [Rhodococcus sp. IEGM 1381]